MLHHQIGQVDQITGGHKARHIGALQHLHELVLDFKTDDVFGPIAAAHHRHLHHQGERRFTPVGIGHTVDVGHAASMQAGADEKAV